MTFSERSPRRFRVICLLVAFCVGIAAGSWFGQGLLDWWLYGSAAALGAFLLFRRYMLGVLALSLAFGCLGFWWSGRHLQFVTITQPLHYEGSAELLSLKFDKPPRQRAVIKLQDNPHKNTRVSVYTYDWTYTPGTILDVKMIIQPSSHLSDRGYDTIGTSLNTKVTGVVAPPSPIYQFRAFMQSRIAACLPEPYASLAVGLLSGTSDSFDTNFRTDLQRTGTTHLVAVSGYNVMIVALVLQYIGRRRSETMGFVLALVVLALYVLLAGAGASIMRGVVMAFLAMWARYLGRVTHRLVLLMLCASILSLLQPLGLLYNLSWQLSFLAFTGILFIHPMVTPILAKKLKAPGEILGETLSAQVLVTPLITIKFGLVSLIAPLVNMVVLGFVPLAMAVSAVQAVLAMLSVELGRLFSWISYPALVLIVKPIQWSSHVPFAAVTFPTLPLVYGVLSYGIIGVFLVIILRKNRPLLIHES